jgi:hypothetical protein
MRIMNIVWPITAWYLGPLALWTYWHIGHLNLVSQSRTGSTTTNMGVDIEAGITPRRLYTGMAFKYYLSICCNNSDA